MPYPVTNFLVMVCLALLDKETCVGAKQEQGTAALHTSLSSMKTQPVFGHTTSITGQIWTAQLTATTTAQHRAHMSIPALDATLAAVPAVRLTPLAVPTTVASVSCRPKPIVLLAAL